MLQGEHSAILSTFIKLPFSIKILVLFIFKWALKTGFTVIFFRVSKVKTVPNSIAKSEYDQGIPQSQTADQPTATEHLK